jgi:hypothetical protein
VPTKTSFIYKRVQGRSKTTSSSVNTPVVNRDRVLSWTDSRTDDGPVPGYKQRISAVVDATSSLTGVRRSYECQPGYFLLRQKRLPGISPFVDEFIEHYHYGDLAEATFPTISAASSSVADTTALMQFTSKIRQAQTALQSGVVLGEIGEAIRMIRHPGQALRTGIDDYMEFLRGNKARRRTSKNFLADTWLEYSFGWKPLISDISAGARALYQIKQRAFDHQVITAVGSAQSMIPTADIEKGIQGGHIISGTVLETAEYIVVYRGAVKLPIGNRLLMTRQNLGFTWSNFIPTVWELIPYSFLVDYFTNIGEVLSSWSLWDANMGWMNRTTIDKRTRKVTMNRIVDLDYNYLWYSIERQTLTPCVSTTEVRTVSRARYAGSLVPDFRFEVPGAGSLKWLNLAALAASHTKLLRFFL